ncbi:MAG: V-type ATP synthase subunit F [Planctomycetota bacterium]|nr:V-type ATP synthase subunit F [Planctomycetota bacterium]
MKFYCIADEDTVRGFRLAGVEGRAAAEPKEAAEALDAVFKRPDVGIVILTDVVAAGIRAQVDAYRTGSARPLIVEIPGPKGPLPGRKTLRQFVQEAIGMSIGQEES